MLTRVDTPPVSESPCEDTLDARLGRLLCAARV